MARATGDKFKRRVREASAKGSIDLDADDFLCDFYGSVLEVRQHAIKVNLEYGGVVWLQRQKTVIEERTNGLLIIYVPLSVVVEKHLAHEFEQDGLYTEPPVLTPVQTSEFNLAVVNYDDGIDDGYIG